ncbi:hypothetical protein BSLG_007604 [Batrachochytrium salamandrivorans]|nr:hypothetical protein BSLG_007604 [Batrachochytrium salamandrivorans]
MHLRRFEFNSQDWLLLCGKETILVGCGLPRLCPFISNKTMTGPLDNTQLSTPLIPDVFRTLPWSSIDLIIIPSFRDISGLPYALTYTSFQGSVVCSEPTADFGRLRTIQWLAQCRARKNLIRSGVLLWNVDIPFTDADVNRSFDKITRVRFGEMLKVGRIEICGQSSGTVLGGTAWTIQIEDYKIGILSDLSLSESIPKRADLAGFDTSDCVISTAVLSPRIHSHRLSKALSSIWPHIHKALNENGTVVFISELCGHMFDLVEIVDHLLSAGGMSDLRRDQLVTASQPLISSRLESKLRLFYHSTMVSLAGQPNPRLVIATDAQQAIAAAEFLDSVRDHEAPKPLIVVVDCDPADVFDWAPLLKCPTEPAMNSIEVQHAASLLNIQQLVFAKQCSSTKGIALLRRSEPMRKCILDESVSV